MITPLGVMHVDELSKRHNDLVVSSEDLKAVAKRERVEGFMKCYNTVMEHMQKTAYDADLFDTIEQLRKAITN